MEVFMLLKRVARAIGAVAACVLLALPAPALAHDFFLLPENFRASGSIDLHATVGSAFPAAEIVVGEDRVAEVRSSENSSLRVSGPSERSLRLSLTASEPGAHIAGVRLLPRDVEYNADQIPLIMEEYDVAEEARAAVAALPAPQVLRASSQRFAKTIICFETCADNTRASHAFGYPLEFVTDPSTPGRFILLSDGQPLANYPVALATGSARARLVTDARGGLLVSGDVAGPFMLFAAHMTAPAATGERFQMLLTSLTTQLR